MKLFSAYNHTFSAGQTISNEIFQIIRGESLEGIWLAHPDYVELSGIGIGSGNKVKTWVNLLQDGNFLYSDLGSEPTLIVSDSQFNDQPSIHFSNDTFQQLLFRYPLQVQCLVVVYLQQQSGSYLIYAPRQTAAGSPDEILYYDAFPPGSSGTLWAREALDGNSVYNATSRINRNPVPPTTFVPLNSVRVLSISEFGGTGQWIQGFGGQHGAIGGINPRALQNSVKGKIAAIIGFKELPSESVLSELESKLGEIYANYTGPVAIEVPKFKMVIDHVFSYDFADIILDEWFEVTSYELISPTGYGLSFVGSILQGTVTDTYSGTLKIKVTNSATIEKQFEFDLEFCRTDAVVSSFPKSSSITLVLSTEQDAVDTQYSGLYVNDLNQVTAWEDARRVTTNSPPVNNAVPVLVAPDALRPELVRLDTIVNNKHSVRFNAFSELLSPTSRTGRTFLWVYLQEAYGNRSMLDTFPDIKGNGELWTVESIGQVHGTTNVTQLNTRVQKIAVNTLSYQNSLGNLYCITATQPDTALSFQGFKGLRGKLVFFCSWSEVLTPSELAAVISLLASRYYASLAPYIFDDGTEYRTQANVTVDLKNKVSDLQDLALSYEILTNHYGGSIDSNGILSFTAVKDEVLGFEIEVTNSASLSSILSFYVDITLKTNPLYLAAKALFGADAFSLFLIAELDSLLLDGESIQEWEDYREGGTLLTGYGTTVASVYALDNRNSAEFALDGSAYFELNTAATGRCFVLVYVRKAGATGRAFLLGQSGAAQFASGENGVLYDTGLTAAEVLDGETYVNGVERSSMYVWSDEIMNVVVINTTADLSFDRIAKDRAMVDRSVKGYIPLVFVLNRTVTSTEVAALNQAIRNYYDSPKFVLLLHFDGGVSDSSLRNKVLAVQGSVTTTLKKFGTHSFPLVSSGSCNFITIENKTDLAFLGEEFTISFWISLNLSFSGRLILYSQTDLWIQYYNGTLYVGRTAFETLALLSWTVTAPFYGSTFHHIQVNRKAGQLYLFVDGDLKQQTADSWEYLDYNTPARIGQSADLTVSSVNCYIDEFVIYRRSGFNDADFTAPAVAYPDP